MSNTPCGLYKVCSPNCAEIETLKFPSEESATRYYQEKKKSLSAMPEKTELQIYNNDGNLMECAVAGNESVVTYTFDPQPAPKFELSVYDTWSSLMELMPHILRKFKAINGNGVPDFDKDDGTFVEGDEADAYLDRLIAAFENSSYDVVYRRMYGVSHDFDPKVEDRWMVADSEAKRAQREAMALWCKWGPELWS